MRCVLIMAVFKATYGEFQAHKSNQKNISNTHLLASTVISLWPNLFLLYSHPLPYSFVILMQITSHI